MSERFITADHPAAGGRKAADGARAWVYSLEKDRYLHTGREGRALLRRHLLSYPQIAPYATPLLLALDDGTTLQLRLSKVECEVIRAALIQELHDDEMAEEV